MQRNAGIDNPVKQILLKKIASRHIMTQHKAQNIMEPIDPCGLHKGQTTYNSREFRLSYDRLRGCDYFVGKVALHAFSAQYELTGKLVRGML